MLWLLFPSPLHAQTAREYQVKAVFLYNFSQFVEWPPAAFESPGSPFVIGVWGSDPFGSYLDEAVAGESILGHPMIVRRYHDIKEINDCHILFVNGKEDTRGVLAMLGHRSILTVGDAPDFARQGGMIRFFTDHNKIKLQINPSAAKAVKLNISAKLLRVADIVNNEG
jgi:hypothetical protein